MNISPINNPISSSFSVISGQQVGLLGGPVFMLYKILGVYHLANYSSSQTLLKNLHSSKRSELQPVFWLEGNDADLNEISNFYGINSQGIIQKYSWKPSQLRGQPIGNYVVDDNLLNLYEQYFSNLEVTPHTSVVKNLVFESYCRGFDLFTANQKFFSKLFKKFENQQPLNFKKMIWFRSDEINFRQFSQTLLKKEIISTEVGKQCPVFALVRRKREALFKKGNHCIIRSGEKINPQKTILLPSLQNRSLLQDAFWKGNYYVAGPAEEKYLSELLPYYQHYQITPAQVIPRMSTTIVDQEHQKNLDFLGLKVKNIIEQENRYLIEIFQNRDPILKGTLKALKKHMQTKKNQEIKKIINNPSFIPSTEFHQVKKYEKKRYIEIKHFLGQKRKDFKKRNQEQLDLLSKIGNWIHPLVGSQHFTQEKFHNTVTFLNRYGLDIIPKLYRQYEFIQKVISLKK